MISQENTDEKYSENSTISYYTESETILTVNLEIKKSKGKKKKRGLSVFQHFSLEKNINM